MKLRTVSILLLLGLAAACDKHRVAVDIPPALPSLIRECETNTARVCGTWTRIPGTVTYSATWVNGSTATITVVQLDDRAVVFTRRDTSGPTSDMTARYDAVPDGNTVKGGQVTWTTGGLTFSGIWDADWSNPTSKYGDREASENSPASAHARVFDMKQGVNRAAGHAFEKRGQ